MSIFNDFLLILGPKLDPKIEEKSIPKVLEKNDGKRVVAKMGQESQSESCTVLGPAILGPGGGGRGRRKPFP